MARGTHVEVSSQPFWLVDPLDGTKEFVKRNGEFTVNIGLIDQGEAVAGVLFAPVLDRLFAAAPGCATVEDHGAAAAAHSRPPSGSEGWVVLESRSHHDSPDLDAFLSRFDIAATKHSGSSLKFALIAEGQGDLYPRFGTTMEWDTAAGHAILNAAGGRITLPDGSPLRYGKNGFINPWFVAWGDSPEVSLKK